jgi:hypothetical protein
MGPFNYCPRRVRSATYSCATGALLLRFSFVRPCEVVRRANRVYSNDVRDGLVQFPLIRAYSTLEKSTLCRS